MSNEQLLAEVWGPAHTGDKEYVKIYIRYLRQKLEKEPARPRYILNERGIGYRFATDPALLKTDAE